MTSPPRKIFAAILAAGGASRFGSTKQAAKLKGVPLVRKAIETAADICGDRVVTVIGHDAETVLGAVAAAPGFVVVNEHCEKGLGTSIAVAARTCQKYADAILLLLADQPRITAEHLQALIDNWTGADDEIGATAFAETLGPPVLFPSGSFSALAALTGDQGARAILRDSRFSIKTVRFEAAAVDIDTPADLDSLSSDD
jgi:molybdenum cofactor cytidylyltransferase